MTGFRVVLDACVLVPIVKADLLLSLADARMFVPLWSDRILDEAERAIVKVSDGRITPERAKKRTANMKCAFEDAEITNWEPLERCIQELPDCDDRHVVAAAVKGGAALIVTDNVKDYPADVLSEWDLEVKSSDEFLLDVLGLHRGRGINCLIEMSERRKNPPTTVSELLDLLERAGAPGFARKVRSILDED